MFDLRYHVASLAAVFLALIIGILVGVGITRGGFVSSAERRVLNDQIQEAKDQRDAARQRVSALEQQEQGALDYVEATYPALMADRLRDKKIVLVSVGSMDPGVRSSVIQTLRDANAPYPVRIRAIKVPVDDVSLDALMKGHPALAQYLGTDKLPELGQALAEELVGGGRTPLWDALASQLVEERLGGNHPTADGVVVARSAKAQKDGTARFLHGFYTGLAAAGTPAVGVEVSGATASAIPAFERAALSTVDSIETTPGRLALALLLAGGQQGHYGVEPTATDGILPFVSAQAATGG
ncbi:MAG: copper transporter [Actinobacteria bacterium]|nr:copper transporter [Actinomycetota bacterium]